MSDSPVSTVELRVIWRYLCLTQTEGPAVLASVDAMTRAQVEHLLPALHRRATPSTRRRTNTEDYVRECGHALATLGALSADAPVTDAERGAIWDALVAGAAGRYADLRGGAQAGMFALLRSGDPGIARRAQDFLLTLTPEAVFRSHARRAALQATDLMADAAWADGVARAACSDPGVACALGSHFTRPQVGAVLTALPGWEGDQALEFLDLVLPRWSGTLTDAEVLALATHPESAVRLRVVLLPERTGAPARGSERAALGR